MLHEGPIIIIDDNESDRDLFTQAIASLDCPNDVILINESAAVAGFLQELATRPIMILSHLITPELSGFTLRKEILELPDTLYRYIPYIFYSAGPEDFMVQQAYAGKADGFFLKPDNVHELTAVLATIINYWGNALRP